MLHPDDARLAVEHGVAAIIVSNHGGRQLDTTVTTLGALPAIVDAAHRITTADISVDELPIPRCSVVLFDYPSFRRGGFPDADRFEPDHWLSTSDADHVPFGVPRNRVPALLVRPGRRPTVRLGRAARRSRRRYFEAGGV